MLSKILIANRGEIAVRVIRTCRELGIAHRRRLLRPRPRRAARPLADEAYALGGQTAAESYLNTEAILDVIERSGADGVHPGYGFFSENADFARAITDRGRDLHRPAARGHRGHGRQDLVAASPPQEAGVAACPAPPSSSPSADEVVAFGEEYGWPVAIKAAYGGGGRGHAGRATSADEAAAALESAQSRGAQGLRPRECYVERYLTWPRHIEMQVFADTHGNAVWLGERDCSAQRRHQKLIEESPGAGRSPTRSARRWARPR